MIEAGPQGALGKWEEVSGSGASVEGLVLAFAGVGFESAALAAWLLSCQEGCISMVTTAFLSA